MCGMPTAQKERALCVASFLFPVFGHFAKLIQMEKAWVVSSRGVMSGVSILLVVWTDHCELLCGSHVSTFCVYLILLNHYMWPGFLGLPPPVWYAYTGGEGMRLSSVCELCKVSLKCPTPLIHIYWVLNMLSWFSDNFKPAYTTSSFIYKAHMDSESTLMWYTCP